MDIIGLKNKEKKRIVLVPLGDINSDLIEELKQDLCLFGLEIIVELLEPEPAYAFDLSRRQYNSTMILKRLKSGVLKEDLILGITMVDLFSKNLTFVFGEAEVGGDVAIISLARLDQGFYGMKNDGELLSKRIKKEAVHELGHVLGLKHCDDVHCVMYYSSDLVDTDNKKDDYCDVCTDGVASFYIDERDDISGRSTEK